MTHTHERPAWDDQAARGTTTATDELSVIYERISEDPTGLGKGVARQHVDVPRYAADNGWHNTLIITDNDESASTEGTRPGYNRLVALIKAHKVRRVVVLHMSRIWRNRTERAQGIDLFRKYGVELACKNGQNLDLSTSEGRAMADLMGSMNTWESEVKAERVADAVRHAAGGGTPTGGIPYGFARTYVVSSDGTRTGVDRQVHHPDEAPIVEEVCRRLLSGASVNSVQGWLNREGGPDAPGATHRLRRRTARGKANPTGTEWSAAGVRNLAVRPVNCGMRWYHEGREDQRLLEVRSDPIITEAQWRELVTRFGQTRPQRPKDRIVHKHGDHTGSRPGGRKHLLTYGVGRCGTEGCGAWLRSGRIKNGGAPIYECDGPGHHVSRHMGRVDAWVGEVMAERLAAWDARDLMVDDDVVDRALAEVTRLKAVGKQLRADHRSGLLSREEFEEDKAQQMKDLRGAEDHAKAVAPTVPMALLESVTGEDAEKRWDELGVAQQVILLEFLVDRVAILPTAKGPGFNTDHVDVVWRDDLVIAASPVERVA